MFSLKRKGKIMKNYENKPEELKDLIFCEECMHFRVKQDFVGSALVYETEICEAIIKLKHNHRTYWEEYGDPKEINKDNKCPYFEPKKHKKWRFK